MPRTGITYEQVLLAADELKTAGQNPTIEKIRHILGAGSNSTISKYLQAWREQSQGFAADKTSPPLPPDHVQKAVERVWQQLREETEANIISIRNEAAELVDNAENRAKIAEIKLNDLQDTLRQTEDRLQTQMAEKELLALDLKKSIQTYEILKERYEGLAQRFTDLQNTSELHLTQLTNAHQAETKRLEEKAAIETKGQQDLLDEVRTQYEKARHDAMLNYTHLNDENKNLNKTLTVRQTLIHEQALALTELKTLLTAKTNEFEACKTLLSEQEKKWEVLQQKSLVADQTLAQIQSWPQTDLVFANINQSFSESLSQVVQKVKDLAVLFVQKNTTLPDKKMKDKK